MEEMQVDVAQRQAENLSVLRATYEIADEMYRYFRASIFKSPDQTLWYRVVEWVPTSEN
jgi:hypothetical protein